MHVNQPRAACGLRLCNPGFPSKHCRSPGEGDTLKKHSPGPGHVSPSSLTARLRASVGSLAQHLLELLWLLHAYHELAESDREPHHESALMGFEVDGNNPITGPVD